MIPASFVRGFAEVATIRLPERPRLAPWLVLVDLGDGRLQLRAADFTFTIPGGLFADAARVICPLLDGARTLAQITEAAGPRFLPGTVAFLLKLFRQRGVLQEGLPAPALARPHAARELSALRLLSHYLTDAEPVLAALARASVAVAVGGPLRERLPRALGELGVGTVTLVEGAPEEALEIIADADLFIAASDRAGTAFFEAINGVGLAAGVRWLRVAFEGRHGILGPTVIPGQTACFTCLTVRRSTHDEPEAFQAYHQQLVRDGDPDQGALSPLTDLVVAQAALEAARLLTGFAPAATLGRFYTFEAGSPRVAGHEVLRVPRCVACGRKQSPRDPWDLRSRLE